jgi:hypothetical protein
MFLIPLIAWVAGVIMSFANGHRKLPAVILVIGLGLLFAPFGVWRIVGIALLAAIIWTANKVDTQ